MKKTRVDRDSQAERSNSLKHLSEDELLDVFETARRRSTRDHALLIVCFQHALRASELISLKLGDIDWRNMEITIQRLKGSLRTTQPLFRMRGRPCMDEVSAFLSAGARIPRIRLAGHPLCPDLCLGFLPTTSVIGL
jgi:integrase